VNDRNTSSQNPSPLSPCDEQAAREIFDRFARRLIGLARTRLDRRIRQKIDPEDVVQSVFRSFFTRRADGQFDTADWDDLWKILVVITVRKCSRKAQAFRAARRDVRREARPAGEFGRDEWNLVSREPTPEEVVSLTETVEQLLRGAGEVERQIVTLRLQGYTPVEISQAVGPVSERRVYRVLARVRKRLMEMCGAAEPEA
jgi:RNA polymerase sigma-70 factor, ECF subfamily